MTTCASSAGQTLFNLPIPSTGSRQDKLVAAYFEQLKWKIYVQHIHTALVQAQTSALAKKTVMGEINNMECEQKQFDVRWQQLDEFLNLLSSEQTIPGAVKGNLQKLVQGDQRLTDLEMSIRQAKTSNSGQKLSAGGYCGDNVIASLTNKFQEMADTYANGDITMISASGMPFKQVLPRAEGRRLQTEGYFNFRPPPNVMVKPKDNIDLMNQRTEYVGQRLSPFDKFNYDPSSMMSPDKLAMAEQYVRAHNDKASTFFQ